jgi:hypothetical protein
MKEAKLITSFFDMANIIMEKKPIPSLEDIEKFCTPYMLNLYFSLDPQFIAIAQEMNTLKLTNKMYFDCLYYGIPKCKKYIKWDSKKQAKATHELYIMEYFGCSQSTAKDYLILLDEKELKYIVDFFINRGTK